MLHRRIGRFFRNLGTKPVLMPNLFGDREIENSWIISKISKDPGNALDVGCTQGTFLGLPAAFCGYNVIGIDLIDIKWNYKVPGIKFKQGDILKLDFESEQFDLIIKCSTIEYVGLEGRYGIVEGSKRILDKKRK